MGRLATRAIEVRANTAWFALGFWLLACGDEPHADKSKADDGPQSCGETGSYAGYAQAAPWSIADFELCNAACPGLESESCVFGNCPAASDFFGCVDEELYACQTNPGGSCRAAYETYGCCAEQHCGDASATTQVRCLERACESEGYAVETCYRDGASSKSFEGCLDKAYTRCLESSAMCMRELASPLPGYTSVRTWTKPWPQNDLAQCETDCAGALSRTACIEEACPGSSQYQSCLKAEHDACSSAKGGACRTPWEGVFCCARSACPNAAPGATFTQCLATHCQVQLALFDTCSSTPDGACSAQAETHCAQLPYPDGLEDAGARDDAGENDAASGDGGTNDELDGSDPGTSDAGADENHGKPLVLPRLLKVSASPNRSKLFPYAYATAPAAQARPWEQR